MAKKGTIKVLVAAAGAMVANEKIQKTLFGTYSDGTPRSLADCLEGEILSPKDRKKMLYKKSGKKKTPKKKKRKAAKIHLFE